MNIKWLEDRLRDAVNVCYGGCTHEEIDAALALDDRQNFNLAKRPVAWRVRDFGDGWLIYQDEAGANADAEHNGAEMQGLYIRDGKA